MPKPQCPACGAGNPRVVLATREFMKLRCAACDASWETEGPLAETAPPEERPYRPADERRGGPRRPARDPDPEK